MLPRSTSTYVCSSSSTCWSVSWPTDRKCFVGLQSYRRPATCLCLAYKPNEKVPLNLGEDGNRERLQSGQNACTSSTPTTQLTKRINSSLFAAQNYEKIQQVIVKQGAVFSAFNVAVCLKELARLYETQGKSSLEPVERENLLRMLSELSNIAEQHITEFGTWTISTCIWAFAKLEYKPDNLLALFIKQANVQLSQLKPLHISKLLWGLGRLNYHPGTQFLLAVGNEAFRRLPEFEPQGLANVVWAYAKLGDADEKLLQGIAQEAEKKLPGFSAQGLSNVVWSFAVLKFHPGTLLPALSQTIIRRLKDCNSQGVANAVWAFSMFNYCPREILGELSCHPDAYLMYCGSADASNILVACARLEYKDQGLLDFLLDRALAVPDKLKPLEVAGVMWSLGKLEYLPSSIQQPLTNAVLHSVHSMSSQSLSNTVWAMARLPQATWSRQVVEQLFNQVQRCEDLLPQHLSNIACASVRLHTGSASRATLRWLATQSVSRVPDFTPEELSLLVWACGKQGMAVEELSARACDSFVERWEQFNQHDVSVLVWGLGKMAYEPSTPFFAKLQTWLELHSAHMTPRQLTMTAWAMPRIGGGPRRCEMDPLLEAAVAKVGGFNSQDVAILSHSLGKMKLYREDLMDLIASRAELLIIDFNPDELVNTVWAFASLGHHPGRLLGIVATQIAEHRSRYERWHLSTLSWAFQQLGYTGGDTVSSGVRSAAMAEGVWEQQNKPAAHPHHQEEEQQEEGQQALSGV